MWLEAMDLDMFLFGNLLVNQKLANLVAMVALQLDDFAKLIVHNECSIACKVLLEGLQNSLLVKIPGESLDSGQSLPAVALLYSDV